MPYSLLDDQDLSLGTPEEEQARVAGMFEDDEGNQYSADQVRQASEAMARDEGGEGSFGGLTASDTEDATPTAAAPARHGRELNPRNFGDFFRDNIFGGLDASYAAGRRPMTAFDYVTDVASAYGGVDLAKRNSAINKEYNDSALTEQRLRTGAAQEKKAGLEADKLANEAIVNMMNDLDSDLWGGELKALSKEHGIQVRPGTIAMVERMAQTLNEAGVNNPSVVLQNPDQYDPMLVSRVRHTMRLLNKSIEESQGRQLQAEQGKMALGMRPGKEQREQEGYEQQQTGVQDAIDLLTPDTQNPDPKVSNLAKARIAALRRGGQAAEQVMAQIAGIQSKGGAGGRGIEFQSYLRKAMIDLGEDPEGQPSSAAIDRALQIRNAARASGEQQVRTAKVVADKQAAVAEGLSQLSTMEESLAGGGFGESGLAGRAKSVGSAVIGRFTDAPSLRVVDAVNATLTNIARSLGGQKGVLSDLDQRLIEKGLAFKPEKGDTLSAWRVRKQYVATIAKRGLEALQQAQKTQSDPVPITLSDEERRGITGDGNVGASGTPAATPEGGSDKQELARQWTSRINNEPDPAKKAQLKQQALEELRR